MALGKRIWRILGENKLRYAGILLLLFLGSFTFAAASGIGLNLTNLVGGFGARNLQEDLSFETDAPIADVKALGEATGAVIDPYEVLDVTVGQNIPLRLLTACREINQPAVKSGRMIAAPGEILLDPYFCTLHDLALGDTFAIKEKPFTIVGTVAFPHYVYALKNLNDVMPPSGFGIGLVSQADLADLGEATTVYSVRFLERQDIGGQSQALHQVLSGEGHVLSDWADAMNNKRIRMPWASITGVSAMSWYLPVTMFLLSCVVVGVVTRRMVQNDQVVIGSLYALGYRRKELIRHYLTIPLFLGLMGGVLGVAFGLPCIAPGVGWMVQSYYNVPNTGILIPPWAAPVGILLPVAFLGLSCWLVIRKVLKKTAHELMRGGSQSQKVSPLERHLGLEGLSFSARFQLRGQLRSLPRLLFLLAGVTVASVMLLFGFTLNHSWKVVFNADDGYHFAYEYSFKKPQQGEVPLDCDPFNAIRAYPQGREGVEFYLMGLEPESEAITMADERGAPLPGDQVNITAPLAKRLGIGPGDTLDFVDKISGKPYSLRVDAVVSTYVGQFIYLPLEELNAMTGQPPGSYSGLLSNRVLEIDERLLSGVKDLKNVNSAADDLAGSMTMMVTMLTLIAALMGAIIIFLVTSLMIEENKATISMLKVFGYRRKEVARLVLGGATLPVILGFLLAIPLMLLSAKAMYGYLGEMINMVMPIVVNPLHVLFSLALILAVYWLTRKFSVRKLEKIPMSTAVKSID